ncbi:uncharacterized protein [Dermacentor albipictus]|uniref:uncharacterized protein n=1 Tax=Dermacentor albipictus TaxID=60249 RepID=UPI0038FC161D
MEDGQPLSASPTGWRLTSGVAATRRCGKLRWELLSVLCDCDEDDCRQQRRVADFVFADIKCSSPDRPKRRKCCVLHCIFLVIWEIATQRRPDAYERLPAESDLCHISLSLSGTLWWLPPLHPTTTVSSLRSLGSSKPLAAPATASCHHCVLTTSTRELAAFVMMPSRLEADRRIEVASKFYPSRATHLGQASCKRRITRLNA